MGRPAHGRNWGRSVSKVEKARSAKTFVQIGKLVGNASAQVLNAFRTRVEADHCTSLCCGHARRCGGDAPEPNGENACRVRVVHAQCGTETLGLERQRLEPLHPAGGPRTEAT